MPASERAALDYKSLVQDDRIHAALYTDPHVLADELDRIFHRGWVFVGHDSEILVEGPAHALIFPNLFLGETNIAIVQPLAVDACVHWHTPMFLKGVPELNGRLLRMAEAGMGPASFLMPDDLIIAARNQQGLAARTAPWLLLSRGLDRERVDAAGRTVSHVTDETTNREFWRHSRRVMSEA